MRDHPWIGVWWLLIVFGLVSLFFAVQDIGYVVGWIVIVFLILTCFAALIGPIVGYVRRAKRRREARSGTAQVKRADAKRREAEANRRKW